jgi:hypothetical protein
MQEDPMDKPNSNQTRRPARASSRSRSRDFYQRYDLLLANWFLLSRRLQQELQFLRRDLHDDLARWRPEQPKPDWNAYADRVRLICKEGGVAMPAYCRIFGGGTGATIGLAAR